MIHLQGPPGKAGPRGPPGARGPGLQPPKLVESILNNTAKINSSVDFKCVFYGNPIPENVEWKYSANHSEVFDSIDVEKSQITSTLRYTNISWTDRGRVTCHAKSLLGEDNGSGNFSVLCKIFIYF